MSRAGSALAAVASPPNPRDMTSTPAKQSSAASSGKVIITCAVTGAIHTPSMSPHLPVTPDEIVHDAIGAAEAGASILHLHARDPANGKPDQTPEAFARFLPRIKQGTNAVVNITTGGSPYMRVEERVLPAATFKPEVASLNMGSMNFGLYHLLDKYPEFEHAWEREYLEATRDLVFRNSFKDIDRHSPDDIQIRGNRTTGPPPRERHLLLQPSDGLILVSGLRLEGHSVIFLAIQTHLSCRFLLTVDFLGPTPERVLAADHRSAVGFSETGRGSPPPPPIGT